MRNNLRVRQSNSSHWQLHALIKSLSQAMRNGASQGILPQLDFGARTPKKPFGNLVRRAPVHVDVIYCMQYVPSLQLIPIPTLSHMHTTSKERRCAALGKGDR